MPSKVAANSFKGISKLFQIMDTERGLDKKLSKLVNKLENFLQKLKVQATEQKFI